MFFVPIQDCFITVPVVSSNLTSKCNQNLSFYKKFPVTAVTEQGAGMDEAYSRKSLTSVLGIHHSWKEKKDLRSIVVYNNDSENERFENNEDSPERPEDFRVYIFSSTDKR
jgi:hypothetical protein